MTKLIDRLKELANMNCSSPSGHGVESRKVSCCDITEIISTLEAQEEKLQKCGSALFVLSNRIARQEKLLGEAKANQKIAYTYLSHNVNHDHPNDIENGCLLCDIEMWLAALDAEQTESRGIISKEEAIELLNTPLQPGQSAAGRVALIQELLEPSGEEAEEYEALDAEGKK